MAERGKNPTGDARREMEEADTRRTERRHFARRHPRFWGHDEMRLSLVTDRLQGALDSLSQIETSEIVEEAEVVSIEDAEKIARAYELIDGLDVHLPEIMAWSVGYPAFGDHRSTFFACTTEEQAKKIAAAMNQKEAISPNEFGVEHCPCRILDMVKPEFSGEDI